jgi:hypothetical protein
MGEAKRRAAGRARTPLAPTSEYPADDWNSALTPAIVPGKSCGSCTKCCTVMAIPELNKPAWQECRHVAAGRGCKIYPDRPSGCRKFICGWLLDPNMGPDLKPENCHVVFFQLNAQNIVASCDADHPGAWRKPNVTAFLHALARSAGPNRRVILMEKGRTWFVNENAIVPVDTG